MHYQSVQRTVLENSVATVLASVEVGRRSLVTYLKHFLWRLIVRSPSVRAFCDTSRSAAVTCFPQTCNIFISARGTCPPPSPVAGASPREPHHSPSHGPLVRGLHAAGSLFLRLRTKVVAAICLCLSCERLRTYENPRTWLLARSPFDFVHPPTINTAPGQRHDTPLYGPR